MPPESALSASCLTVLNGEQGSINRLQYALSKPWDTELRPLGPSVLRTLRRTCAELCCFATGVSSKVQLGWQHMTTRASTARGQDKQQFQGRVRKWRKQWDLASDTAKYKLLKWVPTDERTEDCTLPRFPNLQPILSAVPQHHKVTSLPVPSGQHNQPLTALSQIPGKSQPQSTVGHQSLLINHGIESTVAAPSSTLHANAALAQPTSSMLDASTEATVNLQPAEVISTPDS